MPRWRKVTLTEYLYEKIAVRSPDECWPWTGYCNRLGYGQVGWAGAPFDKPTNMGAHRLLFYATHGYFPPEVRHTCDNPPCCNPDHLVPGTHAENMRDMKERGRSRSGPQPTNHGTFTGYVRGCRCEPCVNKARENRDRARRKAFEKGPPEHGTAKGYGTYGCRCDACRLAFYAKYPQVRRSRRARRDS